MLKGTRWFDVLVSSALIFLGVVPFAYGETASCPKIEEGKLSCVEISMDGALSKSQCWGDHKFVTTPCPTDNLIATCTYEMGMSYMVMTAEGLKPGPVKPVKYQVICYSDKSENDEKKLEACKKQCLSLEGNFSKKVAQKK